MVFPLIGFFTLVLYSIIQPARTNSPQIFVTNSLNNFDARIVEGWSGGGGEIWRIPNDTNHPFPNRQFGGADRYSLMGTAIFGSGYPYGKEDPSTISGRPFPYGLWPIYWPNNTMGSSEYGPALDPLRPGGELVTIPLRTRFYNITNEEVYYIVGDRDSAIFMMISLVTSCHVIPVWPSKFKPNSANATVKIENVIQYYRASSFALAFPGYNNLLAAGNTSTDFTTSTPLPDVVTWSPFRRCIDNVILNALAIMNQPPDLGLSRAALLGIIFGILSGPIAVCLYYVGLFFLTIFRSVRRKAEYTKKQRERILAVRKTGLAYENYP